MRVFRLNERAELPKFNNGSSHTGYLDIKACFDNNRKIVFYNALNKESVTPTRIINGKVCIQIYPQQKVLVPTGLIFEIPENHVLKIYPRYESSLKKGLVLGNGTTIISSYYVEETFVPLHNLSDAVAIIEDGETIAHAMLEQTSLYKIEEIEERPTDWSKIKQTD
jgi:dUTP pyrophosphatase